MFYLEKSNNEVVKYEINIKNIKRLLELREKLINNYSSIIKIKDLYSLTDIDCIKDDNIKNFQKNNSVINFDYYIHPELVSLIDELMNGNANVITNIINYKRNAEFNKENLKIVSKDIYNKLNTYISENELICIKSNNFNLNKLDCYDILQQILNCIEIIKRDSISIDQYNRFLNFINYEDNIPYNKTLEKVRKKKGRDYEF